MSRRKKKSFFSVFRKDKQGGNEGGDLVSRLSNTDQQFRRILFRLLVVLVLIFLGYAFFGGTNGFIHMARLQMKKKELARENQTLLVKLIDADMTRTRLKNDLNYIEYIARTRHLLSRPGEVIYRFKE